MQGIKSLRGHTLAAIFAALAVAGTGGGLAAEAQAPTGPSLLPPVQAARTATAPAVITPTGLAALTRTDAEAWLDGFMPTSLQRGDIAGATIVIVKDGQILLAKGYGYADVANKIPVDPNRHLFRPGSVSKLFTWTAVMQQVEAGKLNLDADINQYLDFKIAPFDGKPITLRNIMTHTSGFEEAIRGLIAADPKYAELESSLKRWVPHRVFAPGSTPAYSNYATALAGYIVQRVSGEEFDAYIEKHIFQPLDMKHASFRQPLPANLAADMAKGYQVGSGKAEPYEIVSLPPAGSLAATATDMGKFMIAHLNDGGPLLKPATARMMHGTPYTVLPPLHRMELGFYEHDINGHHVIAHGGDTRFFHSELNLFLDDHVGMFVSVNSSGHEGGAGALRTALFEQFADRYFPGPQAEGKVDAETARRDAAAMAGNYESSRGAFSSFASLMGFLGQVHVVADGKGGLDVPIMKTLGGAPRKWQEIAPFVWREVGGKDRLAAKVVDGKAVRFSIDPVSPFMMWDRTPWYRSNSWLQPWAYLSLAVLLLTVIAWPIAAGVRRHYKAPLALTRDEARVHTGLRIAALLGLIVPVAWIMTVQAVMSLTASQDTLSLKIILTSLLTLVAYVGGFALALWNGWLAWTNRNWVSKAWSTLLALSFGGLLWISVACKLLSFNTYF